MRLLRWIALLPLLPMLNACAGFAARQIEHPPAPPHAVADSARRMLRQMGFTHEWVNIPGGARIGIWYSPPRAFHFGVRLRFHGAGFALMIHPARIDGPAADFWPVQKPPRLPVRGSVVLLPPFGLDSASLAVSWGAYFASHGYAVVAVDLPAGGGSASMAPGYGPREARALAWLIPLLRLRGLLPAPEFLFGLSYGGDVVLFAAPRLAGITATIALAPFANAAQAIRRAPGSGLVGPRWLGALFDLATMQAAIARADRDLGIDLAGIDPTGALRRARACTLLIGGTHDEFTRVREWRRMIHGAPRAQLTLLPHTDHVLALVRFDLLGEPLRAWMHALAIAPASGCPPFAPRSPAYRMLLPRFLPAPAAPVVPVVP